MDPEKPSWTAVKGTAILGPRDRKCWEIRGVHCSLRDRPFQGGDQLSRNANAKEHAINWLIQKSFRRYGYVLSEGI